MARSSEPEVSLDRRDFPRLKASFEVKFGVCGEPGREMPGFTNDLSLSGLSFLVKETGARAGQHLAVQVCVPGYDAPLYFIGTIVRTQLVPDGTEVACRFDWLGKSDHYKEKLGVLLQGFE